MSPGPPGLRSLCPPLSFRCWTAPSPPGPLQMPPAQAPSPITPTGPPRGAVPRVPPVPCAPRSGPFTAGAAAGSPARAGACPHKDDVLPGLNTPARRQGWKAQPSSAFSLRPQCHGTAGTRRHAGPLQGACSPLLRLQQEAQVGPGGRLLPPRASAQWPRARSWPSVRGLLSGAPVSGEQRGLSLGNGAARGDQTDFPAPLADRSPWTAVVTIICRCGWR